MWVEINNKEEFNVLKKIIYKYYNVPIHYSTNSKFFFIRVINKKIVVLGYRDKPWYAVKLLTLKELDNKLLLELL